MLVLKALKSGSEVFQKHHSDLGVWLTEIQWDIHQNLTYYQTKLPYRVLICEGHLNLQE